jgi:hypothetical protein
MFAALADLNLIRFFDFYLVVAFIVSTTLRVSQYRAIAGLVRSVPSRWPHLFKLVKAHSTIFLTWNTVLPAALALALCVVHALACRLVWPYADLTPAQVAAHWLSLIAVGGLGIAMVGVDVYASFNVGEVNQTQMQKYFDQAEYWLRSWTAPVVRAFTFGYINPRNMVAVEVRKALIEASQLINSTFWWVCLQTGLRVAFGLALWLTYAAQIQ